MTVDATVAKFFVRSPIKNTMANKKIYKPSNLTELHMARDAVSALFSADSTDLSALGDFGLIPLLAIDFRSLCYGCTDKDAQNYDPKAEVDDNTCI